MTLSRNVYVRYFKCLKCGFDRPATKKRSRRTPIEHIKPMWCPRCNAVTEFVQVE